MKKRILSVILAAALLLGLLPGAALAGEKEQAATGALDFGATTQNCIDWVLYPNGRLELSSTQKNTSYTYWLDKGDDVWYGRKYMVDGQEKTGKELVTELVIRDHVALYGNGIFAEYPNLKTVTLPGMEVLPARTFAGCGELETVTVNGSLGEIGRSAFEGCVGLNTVTVKGDVGEIGDSAFEGCNYLNSFTVDGTVASLGNSAFRLCRYLNAFDAPVTGDIGDYAFAGCPFLSRLSPIRGSVGSGVFSGAKDPLNPGVFHYTHNMDNKNLYIVSGHSGTLGDMTAKYVFGSESKYLKINLIYTGTADEFQNKYTNNSGFAVKAYQQLGDSVTWSLQDGVLTISGEGQTIDLLDESEQPWANVSDKLTRDDQRAAITRVLVDPRVTLGAHMLDGISAPVEYYSVSVPGGSAAPDAGELSDVTEGDWFYQDAAFVYYGGYMRGTSAGKFSPLEPMSRAMAVTALHRLAGMPEAAAAGFADVKAGSWYEAAVNWAADSGVTAGVTPDRFDPEAPLSREQLAAFLYRYAGQTGQDVSVGEEVSLTGFPDAAAVSPWAEDALAWAVGAEIIRGDGAGLLRPDAAATRAEFAALLRRYVRWTEAAAEAGSAGA